MNICKASTAIFEMRHTINLLQESLDLARLDLDSICYQITSVQLNNLVSETIAAFQKFEQREILVEGEELNITVLADADRLTSISWRSLVD